MLAKSLDVEVAAFRSRPLDGGAYPYLWLDALSVKAREDGRVVSVATVVASAVSADGHREILGLDTFTAEDGAAWTRFLRDLSARGLSGVRLVISDDHKGLVGAIAAVLPGASWQRCRTHFLKNLLCRVPRSAQHFVATLVRTIFAQPSAEEVQAQLGRVIRSGRPKSDSLVGDTAPGRTPRRSSSNDEKTQTQPLPSLQSQGGPGSHQG